MLRTDIVEGTLKHPLLYRLRLDNYTLFSSLSQEKVQQLYNLFRLHSVGDSLSFKMLPNTVRMETLLLGFDGEFPLLTKDRLCNLTPFEAAFIDCKPYMSQPNEGQH